MVEQLEIAASATSDALAAFRDTASAAQEGAWRDVGTELERYGEQREREALSRAELPLKQGVVRA